MKKRKKNHPKLWSVGVMAILLLAVQILQADETIPAGQSKDIDYAVDGILWINGTANFRTGASAPYVYVQNGGTVNMYSGAVDWFINVSPTDGSATVYGTDFTVSNGIIDLDGNWIPDRGMGTLTGKYEDKSDINLWILSDTAIKLVDIENNNNNDELIIDIKPGSDENVINLKSRGVVPVAVLTTDEFNAGDLVPGYSISFAGASPVHTTLCDVDRDGDMDMLFFFRTQHLVELNEDSIKATLTATLKSTITKSSAVTGGDIIEGSDKVKIKSSKKRHHIFSNRYGLKKYKRRGWKHKGYE